MDIVVLGGGITGRLVQHVIPLAQIFEARSASKGKRLTRNFGTNYLWEPLQGIECFHFPVITHVDGKPASEDAIQDYKSKVGRTLDPETWHGQFLQYRTGWDFVHIPEARIIYETAATVINLDDHQIVFANGRTHVYDHLISTIPLPDLMNMCQPSLWFLADGVFSSAPIYVKIAPRPPDAPMPLEVFYVNYLSSPTISAYRFCDRMGERHYEGLTNMGVTPNKKIYPGKIFSNKGTAQILDALSTHRITCFGRFATWNPRELIHETFREIRSWATRQAL